MKYLVQLNGSGEIISDRDGRAPISGIFACRDMTDIPYKQAVISAGQGAAAAASACNYIQKQRGKLLRNPIGSQSDLLRNERFSQIFF